ncbi:MAG: hypothetical protein ACI857_000260 [Arenicella sp.]|jgi:hypothetical protein
MEEEVFQVENALEDKRFNVTIPFMAGRELKHTE